MDPKISTTCDKVNATPSTVLMTQRSSLTQE